MFGNSNEGKKLLGVEEHKTSSFHTENSQITYQQNEKTLGKISSKTAVNISNNEAKIEVCDPIIKQETLKSYVLYTIKGQDKIGTFECHRRYSDFKALRDTIVSCWPGTHIPPIPDKKATGNLDPRFVEERRKFLQQFLEDLTKLNYIYESEEMQQFLRSKVQDAKKTLSLYGSTKPEHLVPRLEKTFAYLIEKPLDNETLLKITSFHAYLKRVKSLFDTFESQALTLVQAKQGLFIVGFQSQLILNYEKTCLSEYAGEKEDAMVFTGNLRASLDSKATKIRKDSSSPSFELVYEMIRAENREIEAFLELFKRREEIDAHKAKVLIKSRDRRDELERLHLGKVSVKSLFNRKSKEEGAEELKAAIEADEKEIEATEKLRNIVSAIISYQEIDRFKARKADKYYKIVKECAEMELQAIKNVGMYWYSVLESPRIVMK